MSSHLRSADPEGVQAESRRENLVPSPSSPFRRRGTLFQLPLPFSERRILLTGLDLLAVNGPLFLLLALQRGDRSVWSVFVDHPLRFLLLTVLWLLLANAFDAYDLGVSSKLSTAVPAVLRAGVPSAVILSVFSPGPFRALAGWASSATAFAAAVAAFLVAGRALYALALFQPVFHHRALIIGAGWAGRTIAQALTEHSDGTHWVVGFVDDDPAKQGASVQLEPARGSGTPTGAPASGEKHTVDQASALRVLGDGQALRRLISEHSVTTLILAITHDLYGELLQTLMDCLEVGVEIIAMPVLYEQLTGRVPVEHVGSNWSVAMPVHHPGIGTMWPLLKRSMDIVLSGIGLLLLGLFTPLIALAIYLDSPGPVFYTQMRVGKGGRRFRAYKFRSMVPDAETGGAVWARKGDRRVTRVGRLLRMTHVDEFPQFLNILKGDMSVVGPRPERPEFVEKLADDIPFFRVRHAVRPGMAGWALVKQGYGSSKEDALLKLQYDLYYIKHQSFWLDVSILLKTLVDSFSFRGR